MKGRAENGTRMTRKTIRTMEELAFEIDVSRPTLSRYFHDPSSVRSNTRAKIEARLAAVDYVPNFFARNLNRKRTRMIGVVVPHLKDIFQTSLINAIDAAAGHSDYKIIVQNSDNDPAREVAAIEALRSMNADGILIAPLGLASDTDMLRRAEAHLPLVLIDSHADTEVGGFDFVGNDNQHSVGLVVDYLVRSGRDPVFLPMPPVNMNAVERTQAYRAAMARHNRPAEVLTGAATGPHWDFERHGHAVMSAEFAAGRHTQSTVLCASDRVAMGALKAAHEFGLFPQGKVAGFHLAGHDNDALTRFLHPGLTTVEQDVPRIAREAVAILLGRIEAPRAAGAPHDFRRIPARLVLRESA